MRYLLCSLALFGLGLAVPAVAFVLDVCSEDEVSYGQLHS